MATDIFPAEEYGSGSRLTPLVDAPAWVKAQARREASGDGDRATLTPDDRAFLESVPSYEASEESEALASLAPPPALPAPSTLRRVVSLLLFATIATGACAVLGLAVLRMLGKVVVP